jgi:hypothetical protein
MGKEKYMEEKFIEWTIRDSEIKTNMNNMKYQHIKDGIQHYETDDKKESRESKHHCKYCYYIRNVCGFSAITTSYCGICKEPIINSSSDTDKVCDICAEYHGLCVHCGGKMD